MTPGGSTCEYERGARSGSALGMQLSAGVAGRVLSVKSDFLRVQVSSVPQAAAASIRDYVIFTVVGLCMHTSVFCS